MDELENKPLIYRNQNAEMSNQLNTHHNRCYIYILRTYSTLKRAINIKQNTHAIIIDLTDERTRGRILVLVVLEEKKVAGYNEHFVP